MRKRLASVIHAFTVVVVTLLSQHRLAVVTAVFVEHIYYVEVLDLGSLIAVAVNVLLHGLDVDFVVVRAPFFDAKHNIE